MSTRVLTAAEGGLRGPLGAGARAQTNSSRVVLLAFIEPTVLTSVIVPYESSFYHSLPVVLPLQAQSVQEKSPPCRNGMLTCLVVKFGDTR